MDEYRDAVVTAYARALDAEYRRMLGLWVSELEPWAIYDQDGRLLGLSVEGHGRRIYVPALEPWDWCL